jgi:hypothetical protein
MAGVGGRRARFAIRASPAHRLRTAEAELRIARHGAIRITIRGSGTSPRRR